MNAVIEYIVLPGCDYCRLLGSSCFESILESYSYVFQRSFHTISLLTSNWSRDFSHAVAFKKRLFLEFEVFHDRF